MHRDTELIRKILFAIEDKYVDKKLSGDELEIDGYDIGVISYHCAILFDGGFLSEYEKRSYINGSYWFQVGRLTWNGHELLEKITHDMAMAS